MDREEVARRLADIRKVVREQLAMEEPGSVAAGAPPGAPARLRPGVGLVVRGEPNLTATPDLEAANATIDTRSVAPSRAPVVGPLINLLRTLTGPLVRVFLGGYLARQQEFNAHTVRHLNELGNRLENRVRGLEEALETWSANPSGIETRLAESLNDYDAGLRQRHMTLFSALEEEIFVARKAADDVLALEHKFVERAQDIDRRFSEKDQSQLLKDRALATRDRLKDQAYDMSVAEFRSRDDALGSAVGRLEGQIAELLAMRSLLKQVLDRAAVAATGVADATAPASASTEPWDDLSDWLVDEDYRAFQAGFRGDPDAITERMRAHVARFEGVREKVADLGCGRGEFLDLLDEAGIDAVGVEINAADVEECARKGHEAVVADLFEWLEERAEGSLGGIFMAQVIEHLPPPAWQRLVELAATRLEPGGRLVVETINPQSLYALARAYVLDPTHVRPVHPELLAFLARRAGLHPVEIRYQAPVPVEERATGVSLFDGFGAIDFVDEEREEIAALKEGIARLDRICCAPQEYTLSAMRVGGIDVDAAADGAAAADATAAGGSG